LHPNAQRVQDAIRASGASCRVVELPASTRSAADAASAIGTSVAQIVKSLVFLAGEDPVLVLASGANRVSLDKLAAILGHPVRRADADAVKRLTGFAIGGVAPLGLERSMPALIDEDLRPHAEVWAAAGTPHAVFCCSPDELARMSAGQFADVKDVATS
jgi:prolyl-tRNA editing enzyme YbaK/EbsC (Cys-tRNA(Pro) deacylase)